MKKTFILKIRTPFEKIMDEEIKSLNVNTEAGEITILPSHAKMLSTILFSPLIIRKATGDSELLVRGGILQVDHDNNTVNILCQSCTKKYQSVYFDELEKLEGVKEKLETRNENIFNDMQYAYLETEMVSMMRKIAYLKKEGIDKKPDKK